MEKTPRVIVEPPDSRGLRAVSVGGTVVGSAWSPSGLRKVLRELGCPESVDLEDRRVMVWREAGSEIWPDRTWRRRTATAFMMAGLLLSTVLLTIVGTPDAMGALTFAQRITGFLFILSGAVQGLAALAALDHEGKRQFKYSGAVVLVGVLIALITESIFLFTWLQEREPTLYLPVYLLLFTWSLWALWRLFHGQVWRVIPHPKRFATGVALSGLLASTNFAYSAIYQPTSAPFYVTLTAKFGTPHTDPTRPFIHVPLTFRVENTGKVPAYVLADKYLIYGRSAEYSEEDEGLRDWKKALENGGDAELHVAQSDRKAISAGQFTGPGYWLHPGEGHVKEKVIQIPRSVEYDLLEATLAVVTMRMDRGKIDLLQLQQAHPAWQKKEGRFYCAICGDMIIHEGKVRHNNNIINVTRKPRYVTVFWSGTREEFDYAYAISSYKFDSRKIPDLEELGREIAREEDRYGVESRSTSTRVSVAALMASL
ncbi:Yip1 family protein [Streptomyces coeruleorubidus]|uniref:Yip1 family protein n=1 Tax=Streptomyces coeruleorubidus TaxID=116188 RepID=UPI0036A5B82B